MSARASARNRIVIALGCLATLTSAAGTASNADVIVDGTINFTADSQYHIPFPPIPPTLDAKGFFVLDETTETFLSLTVDWNEFSYDFASEISPSDLGVSGSWCANDNGPSTATVCNSHADLFLLNDVLNSTPASDGCCSIFGVVTIGTYTVTEVPAAEPTAWVLMLTGIGGLGGALRSHRRRIAMALS